MASTSPESMPANRSTDLAGSASFFADGEAAIAAQARVKANPRHQAFFHESKVIRAISKTVRALFLYGQPCSWRMQLASRSSPTKKDNRGEG
jgi:hypothetical protein